MEGSVEAAARLADFAGAPEILTARELETLIRLDVKTIYNYVKRGLIPYLKIQSNIRFRKNEIIDWLEKQSYRPRPVNGNGATRRQR